MTITIRPPSRGWFAGGLLVAMAALGLAACNSDDAKLPPLSPAGEAGHTLYLQGGCSSCHGTTGAGGVGPPVAGLFGTQVELEDGRTVTADAEYLTKAIADPSAERVKGYNVVMPDNRLTDEQISQVIDFIEEIGPDSSATDESRSSSTP